MDKCAYSSAKREREIAGLLIILAQRPRYNIIHFVITVHVYDR